MWQPGRGGTCRQWCRRVGVYSVRAVGGVHSGDVQGEHDRTKTVVALCHGWVGGLLPRILFGPSLSITFMVIGCGCVFCSFRCSLGGCFRGCHCSVFVVSL